MANIFTALVGAIFGLAVVWLGFTVHAGLFSIDGPWANVASAVTGAVVALLAKYAIGNEYG
jgi:hypothetical protein